MGVVIALALAVISLGTPAANAAYIRTGAYARTTAALNLRTGPSTAYAIKRVVPYGARVWINAGPYNSVWYKVTYYGSTGYMHSGYLTQSTTSGSTSTSYSGKGSAIASTAKQYVGYRYNYYGNSPAEGFSCTGLVQWVLSRNGVSVPLSLWGQYSRGYYVSRGDLRPGDIVFFQNTWWAGLSHAGVYVGNGWMVDASTPSTGVVWSNIYSSYYSYRWYGGRRIYN